MKGWMRNLGLPAAALCVVLLASACAGIRVATLALPAELQGSQPEALADSVAGAPAGPAGLVGIDGGSLRFERSADRLTLLDRASRERAMLQLDWQATGQPAIRLRCRLSCIEVSALGATATVQPLRLDCEGDAGQVLRLAERAAGPGIVREGEFRLRGLTLQLRSLHRVAGSPLPLAEPAGYAVLHEGRAVAAVERLSSTPRLWRADATAAVREAATQAALVLALAWDSAPS